MTSKSGSPKNFAEVSAAGDRTLVWQALLRPGPEGFVVELAAGPGMTVGDSKWLLSVSARQPLVGTLSNACPRSAGGRPAGVTGPGRGCRRDRPAS